MRVLVTGGTGFIGSHTVAALAGDGHHIRLLVRDESRVAPALEPLGVPAAGVDIAGGDITDAAAVARAVSGCDAVVHAAGLYSFDSRDHARMPAVNVAGTQTVLDAARAATAGPVIHVSSFGALLPARGRPLTADSRPGRPRERYLATKAAADRIARRHQRDGAPVVITYPMATLGPHDPHLGDQLSRLRNTLRGIMPLWPSAGFPVGDVRDVAALHAAAVRRAAGPARLLAPGRYLSTRDYLDLVRAVTGRRLPAVFVPARALLPVGLLTLMAQRACPWHIPAEYGAIYTCACAARPAGEAVLPAEAPALPADGAAPLPRPLIETMADAVRWLWEHGHITTQQAGAAARPAQPPATGSAAPYAASDAAVGP